jgi:hypothetical protein
MELGDRGGVGPASLDRCWQGKGKAAEHFVNGVAKKKPRTGGAGLLGSFLGGTCDGEGTHHSIWHITSGVENNPLNHKLFVMS